MPSSWQPPAPSFSATTSNWYLRGDLAYRFNAVNRALATGTAVAPDDNTLDGSFGGGFGFGFKVDSLRADLTFDYAPAAGYRGTAASGGMASAKVQSSTALFNLYYDIGTWNRITPYIGAGAGFGYVRTSDYQSTLSPQATTPETFGRVNFAWGLMTGASYALTNDLLVDVGYRYLGVGDAETGGNAASGLVLKKIAAHEIRAGVRWMFQTP